ncbi:ABC transporter permease [Aeromicrobium camelliae]|uniref:ABC transporter permease n=2 Tax=Aeromicrobium TaxID=2040 RepID=A0A3N6XX99_9ACTN|nr:ABC transporter permease [Aeromicrobium camelliae]RQN02334.1 ABC transporter permease [Aeromicrobium camelliae]
MGILGTAAALFAGSYTYASSNPQPEYIPVAVVDSTSSDTAPFVQAVDEVLNGSLQIRHDSSISTAQDALAEQDVFAIFDATSASTLVVDVSSASGLTVASSIGEAVEQAATDLGVEAGVTDLHPLQDGDPHGLTIFYMTIASVVIGFVGAVQLGVNAKSLRPGERIAFTAAYAVFAGFTIVATVDWLLGTLDLPFVESWGILALTMFACGMVYTMFNDLFGRWAMLPTWGLMILLGNPSSGGVVAWPFLPQWLAVIGGWLPPGASVNAQHTAVYFPGHQRAWPFLVLLGWAALGIGVHIARTRSPRHDRATDPAS